jgi:hypothetical protein
VHDRVDSVEDVLRREVGALELAQGLGDRRQAALGLAGEAELLGAADDDLVRDRDGQAGDAHSVLTA